MEPVPSPEDRRLEQLMARHGFSGDALIEVLHAAQKIHGRLPAPVLRHIAQRLKLPPSRVFGVATFYHLFHVEPRARHRITICEGTACYVAGAIKLLRMVQRHRDSGWDLEIGRCVGFCGLAPVAVCDGVTIGRLDADKLETLLAKESSNDR